MVFKYGNRNVLIWQHVTRLGFARQKIKKEEPTWRREQAMLSRSYRLQGLLCSADKTDRWII